MKSQNNSRHQESGQNTLKWQSINLNLIHKLIQKYTCLKFRISLVSSKKSTPKIESNLSSINSIRNMKYISNTYYQKLEAKVLP